MKLVQFCRLDAWQDHHREGLSRGRVIEAWILGALAVLGWVSALLITLVSR